MTSLLALGDHHNGFVHDLLVNCCLLCLDVKGHQAIAVGVKCVLASVEVASDEGGIASGFDAVRGHFDLRGFSYEFHYFSVGALT